MKPGLYITYSDLFDKRPTTTELLSLLKGIPLRHATHVLSYMNLLIRAAMQERSRENFGKIQAQLFAGHLDDECFGRVKQRLPFARCEDRPIFLPHSILNVLRVVLTVGDPTPQPRDEEDERIRFLIGRACLMVNDLLVSEEEAAALMVGTQDDRRVELIVQTLAGFELANAPQADHLMPRLEVMYRTLLLDTTVKSRIARQYPGFDFEAEFEKGVGISLERWLLVVFSIYAYFTGIGCSVQPDVKYMQIDPSIFRGESGITQAELEVVLRTISSSPDELRQRILAEGQTDPRYDLVSLRSTPLIRLEPSKLAPVDTTFILEKCHTGVQWTLHDCLPSRMRQTLFNVWGVLFEEYVHWLFRDMKTNLPVSYLPSPKFAGTVEEAFDGALIQGGVLVACEYKGGFLSRKARYSGDFKVFLEELNRKFADGCEQLADSIALAFAVDERKTKAIDGVDSDAVRAVVPVLVLQDHIFRVPDLNWYLNLRFQQRLRSHQLRPGVVVRSLTVLSIHDLESMIHSVEAMDFDFVYALHHRTVRDVEVLSQMHDYLSEFKDFGRKASPRLERILQNLFETITSYLFPGGKWKAPADPPDDQASAA